MFLFLFFFVYIYIQFGLLVSLQIIILVVIFFLSNFVLGIDPDKFEFKVIRLVSVLLTFLILYLNIKSYTINTLLPYSLFKITFLNDLKFFRNIAEVSFKATLHFYDKLEFKKMLNELEDGKIYSGIIEFVSDIRLYNDKDPYPKLLISKPVVFTKDSSPDIISDFVYDRLYLMCKYYQFEDTILNQHNSNGPVVIISFMEIDIK